MRRFAVTAAVLALFSVSIAVAQRQEQPADAEVSGVFSVLKVGDWVTIDAKQHHIVLKIRKGTPEAIRVQLEQHAQLVREAERIITERFELSESERQMAELKQEVERLELKLGVNRNPARNLYEVVQLSGELVTLSSRHEILHIPHSSVQYIVGPPSEARGVAD